MTRQEVIAVYEKFLKANPHVPTGQEMFQRIVDRYNASQPLPFTVEVLTKIAGDLTRDDNAIAAGRFIQPLDADTMRLTLEANPLLAQALDGELSTPLDLSKVKIVSPAKVQKFAGTDIEKARYAKQIDDRDRARRNAAAVETNRGVSNAMRGSRFDQSKG